MHLCAVPGRPNDEAFKFTNGSRVERLIQEQQANGRSRMKSRKIRSAATFVALSVGSLAVLPGVAHAATRIVFPRGSYCGTYSGNYHNGRQFVLGLAGGQRFTVANTGVGNQTTWSVSGPTGELSAYRVTRSLIEYYTEADGPHYVYVTSTARRSSIQFCAY